jgi:hypothetical protein
MVAGDSRIFDALVANSRGKRMSVFMVSFRIADRTTVIGSYEERYDSVNTAIQSLTTGMHWSETTPFHLIESDLNSAELATSIDRASLLDHGVDLLVCVNLSKKGYKVVGDNRDQDIDAIMAHR